MLMIFQFYFVRILTKMERAVLNLLLPGKFVNSNPKNVFSAKDIPERMEIYTTLLGLINLKNHQFVVRTVNLIIRELKDSLKAGRFDDVKYLVRFLSNSVNANVIHPGSLISLYENFVEVTLEDSSSSQCRTDWFCYIVLYSLPYVSCGIFA